MVRIMTWPSSTDTTSNDKTEMWAVVESEHPNKDTWDCDTVITFVPEFSFCDLLS